MNSGWVGYGGLPPLGRRPSSPVASFTARANPCQSTNVPGRSSLPANWAGFASRCSASNRYPFLSFISPPTNKRSRAVWQGGFLDVPFAALIQTFKSLGFGAIESRQRDDNDYRKTAPDRAFTI